MTGTIRLFEKDAAGLLIEVDPASAEKERDARSFSRTTLVVDILFTDEEEAVRRGEAELAKAEKAISDTAKAKLATDRAAAMKKLGLSEAEVTALLKGVA